MLLELPKFLGSTTLYSLYFLNNNNKKEETSVKYSDGVL